MMIGALRRLFGTVTPDEVYRRAARNDTRYFDSLYVPLAARALTEGGAQMVLLSQRGEVRDLDADHAIVVLTSPKPRVFGTELGMSMPSRARIHFLVELDPYASGPDCRVANCGEIDLPADPDGVCRTLAAAALRIVGAPAAPAGPPPEQRLAQAAAALQRSDFATAFAELSAVAKLAATHPHPAMQAMAQLANLARMRGDTANARSLIDTARELASIVGRPEERAMLLVQRAQILDEAGDPHTADAWIEAASQVPPPMQLIYRGHAAGASIRARAANGQHHAAALVAQLGANPDPALLAGVLGAIGRSAGPHDVGYLAQAAWVMWHIPGAYVAPNLISLALLVERVGPATELGLRVATLATFRTFMVQPPSNDPEVIRQTQALIERVGSARNLAMQGVLELIARDDHAVAAIDVALQSLASQAPWLVPLGGR